MREDLPLLLGAAKKHLSVGNQVHVSGTSMLKHFHLRNQRNHCNQYHQRNQSNLENTAQCDLLLVVLQTSIDYADYCRLSDNFSRLPQFMSLLLSVE